MGKQVTLSASDGHRLGAYLSRPENAPRAGLVICQEVFGVNAHIRSVADAFAADGYLAVAPALFDRVERGVELAYSEPGLARGRELRTSIPWDTVMLDVAAAAEQARTAGGAGVAGYCWGGSLAWLAACRLEIEAAVGYYGGQIHEHRNETPRCPVMLHFGELDPMIPNRHVLEIGRRHPEVRIFTYQAGHGFNCDARADYDAGAAALARRRTLEFLVEHLG